MANTYSEFPTEYLDALDEVLLGATYASRYGVQGAEFVNARTVKVPDISFTGGVNDYDRFQTEDNFTLNYTAYTLDKDKQGTFYIDAVDAIDAAAASATNVISEFERQVFAPLVDKDFFAGVIKNALTKGQTTLSVDNIKAELRKARTQFTEHGLSGGDLYMTSEALALLEDATKREWSNETTIQDTVGVYNGFQIFEVPSDILGESVDFVAISGGTNTARYITKRAVSYLFAPGTHTNGDGWLAQMRWVYGTIVRKNKKPGIYANDRSEAA